MRVPAVKSMLVGMAVSLAAVGMVVEEMSPVAMGQQIPAVAYERFSQEIVLLAGTSMTQTFRLDQGDLSRILSQTPGPSLHISSALLTNPMWYGQQIAAGPVGQRASLLGVIQRNGSTVMTEPARLKLSETISTAEPAEKVNAVDMSATQEGRGVAFHGRAVRHQHFLDRPAEDPLQRGARLAAADERQTELARYRWLCARHQVELRHHRPPARQSLSRNLLKQIGEHHCPARAVEEHDLGGDQIAPHRDLVDLACPIRRRRVAQLGIERQIVALLAQPRRGVEPSVGISALPLGQEQMVERIRRDDMRYPAERIDRRAQIVRQSDRRANDQAAIRQPNNRHPSWIMEPGDREFGAIGDPDIAPEFPHGSSRSGRR